MITRPFTNDARQKLEKKNNEKMIDFAHLRREIGDPQDVLKSRLKDHLCSCVRR